MNSSGNVERFQILSLDGGGIKGLFSAVVLAAVEQDLNTSVTDHFDLIAGTSTGGIIALALGLGIRPREIVNFYVKEGPKIFPRHAGINAVQHWVRRKFSAEPLEAALKRRFKKNRFGDSTKRLVIPAYNLGEDDVYIFRTAHHERLRRDYKLPAWVVARSTSAAPTFFPVARHADKMRLIDGGVWANNPAMVAVIEAIGTLSVPPTAINLLSIGTSDPICHRRRRLNNGGKLAWVSGGAAIDIIMRGQSIAAQNQVSFLLGRDRAVRLDPKVADGEFTLDGTQNADDLIAKAAHISRTFMPTFHDTFAQHTASPFKSIYT
jgi:patatin-like phospholipase/acyl hydrolase